MSFDPIDPYPWFLNKPLDLVVNDHLIRTRITVTEWVEHWRPFLGRVREMYLAHRPKRFVIAVAGPPGVGKSVFGEQLHWIIERGFLAKDVFSVALPMDGFHYPNTYLAAHTRKLPDGREIPLSEVKGAPDTIDVKTLRKYLHALVKRPESLPWPGYSRFTHDVVPDKHHVSGAVNFVIVEGNYLLVDRGGFAGMPAMFDLRVYIDAPAAKIIANLVERHIRGGKDLQDAKDWVKRIDLPNARVAEATKGNADVVIERDTDEDLSSVVWKGETPTVNSKAAGEAAAVVVPAAAVVSAAEAVPTAPGGAGDSGTPVPAPPAA